MIANEEDFQSTLSRIERFHRLVLHLQDVETNPETYRACASGYLAEIERMQLEIGEYLRLHPSDLATPGRSDASP